jgi:hypothetical protein
LSWERCVVVKSSAWTPGLAEGPKVGKHQQLTTVTSSADQSVRGPIGSAASVVEPAGGAAPSGCADPVVVATNWWRHAKTADAALA